MGVKNSRKLKKKRIKVGHISVKLKKKTWTQMCPIINLDTNVSCCKLPY